MDGLDIAYCKFEQKANSKWQLTVYQTETAIYPEDLLEKLKESMKFTSNQLLLLDKELGLYFSKKVNEFICKNKISKKNIDAIASHGHTIFHQPNLGYTYQVGCGETIAYHTKLNVINDFRQKDVIAGGQGAPLVPIGDKLLFSNEAKCFLNLGGFANCCFIQNENVIAYDISPANLPLNKIVNQLGLEYDNKGDLARTGEINVEILAQLNALSFYQKNHPKSLGAEWLEAEFYPIISKITAKNDQLRTIIEHIAQQIAKNIKSSASVYITGGGVKNSFLMERIKHFYKGQIILPSEQIIDFKEAIVFGFLGALFLEKTANTLSSVTGAKEDVIGGVLHTP